MNGHETAKSATAPTIGTATLPTLPRIPPARPRNPPPDVVGRGVVGPPGVATGRPPRGTGVGAPGTPVVVVVTTMFRGLVATSHARPNAAASAIPFRDTVALDVLISPIPTAALRSFRSSAAPNASSVARSIPPSPSTTGPTASCKTSEARREALHDPRARVDRRVHIVLQPLLVLVRC